MPFRDSARENSRFYRREILLGSFLKRFLPNHLDATFSFSFRGYINSNSGEEFVSMRHQPFNMSSPPPPFHRSSRLHSTMCRALFHVAYTSTLSCLLTLEQNEFRRVCWCTDPPPLPRLAPLDNRAQRITQTNRGEASTFLF